MDPEKLNLAQRYDDLQKKALPYWDVFFGTFMEFIPEGTVDILELGCGTGFLTGMIRDIIPEATLTGIDKSREMLTIARSKPNLLGVTFIEGDFRNTWPEASYDIVVASQCLFSLPEQDRTRIISRVYKSLRSEGRFINGDAFRPENDWEEGIYRSHWRHFMREYGVPAEEIMRMMAGRDEIYENLPTLNGFSEELRHAGFDRILWPYWYEMYGIVVAFR